MLAIELFCAGGAKRVMNADFCRIFRHSFHEHFIDHILYHYCIGLFKFTIYNISTSRFRQYVPTCIMIMVFLSYYFFINNIGTVRRDE